MAIASKIKQMDFGDNIQLIYLGYAVNCKRVRLPNTLTKPAYLFAFGLEEFDLTGQIPCSSYSTLSRLERVILDSSFTTLPSFQNCYSLKEINLDNITVYPHNSLMECSLVDMNVVFNKDLQSIGNSAFCRTHIKSVRFQNSLDALPTVSNNAFIQCNKLTDIYCPWAEGEVANAPWGATNATIHYNYTGEVE